MYNYISYVVAHTKRTGPGRVEGVAHYILYCSHYIFIYDIFYCPARGRRTGPGGALKE